MWITTLFARTVHISGRWNFSPISYLSLSFPFERVGCLGKLGADEGEGQQSFNSVSFVLSILNSRMEDTGNQCLRTTFLNHLPLINMYHKDMMKVNIFVFMCSRYHIIFCFFFCVCQMIFKILLTQYQQNMFKNIASATQLFCK